MYKFVAFDIDGTLVDTERTYVLSLVDTVSTVLGRKISENEAFGVFGLPTLRVPSKFGVEESKVEEFLRYWEKKYHSLLDLIVPFPGVEDLLKKVKAEGYITAVVTSRNSFELRYDKNTVKFLDYIDIIVSASETARHKPFPDPMIYGINKASERIGHALDPKECLYLGDTPYDRECGVGAGADFALADWRSRGFQGIDADYRFTTADEAWDIISGNIKTRR